MYGIEEMPAKGKVRVLEDNRYINIAHEDWDETEEAYWKEQLVAMGFIEPVIACSGFSCQGDGASFTAAYVNLDVFLNRPEFKREFRLLLVAVDLGFEIHVEVVRESHDRYVHKNTISAQLEDQVRCEPEGLRVRIYNLLERLEAQVLETAREMCDKIYKAYEEEYDHFVSDEAVENRLDELDYRFTSEGICVSTG